MNHPHQHPPTKTSDVAMAPVNQQRHMPPPPRFQLLIDCRSEAEQQALYELFRGDGLRCRVLVTA